MKKISQKLAVIAFGVVSSATAVAYFTRSEPKAIAQPSERRDVPYMDGKWIRYSTGLTSSLHHLKPGTNWQLPI